MKVLYTSDLVTRAWYFSEGDDVIDDRRMEEPHLIFPWTRPPIFSHNQEGQ